MLEMSISSATTGRKTIARTFMKSAICVKGHTTNQSIATRTYGIYEKYLLFKLYHCFLSCFTASLIRSLTSRFTCSVARCHMHDYAIAPSSRATGVRLPARRGNKSSAAFALSQLHQHHRARHSAVVSPCQLLTICHHPLARAYHCRPKGIITNNGFQTH